MWRAGLLVLSLLVPQPEQAKRDTAEQHEKKLHEVVIVTASRLEQPLVEAVSLVTVISAQELQQSPNLVLDDQLRRVPGFSLFRRSSSLVAHPTAQGVSLRGIGPSGTSRSLVLFDGIPLNDPFGGWVYWNRLPLLSLQAVEVARGATSQLYGSSALGGTIQLISRKPQADTVEMRGQYGSPRSYDVEVFGSDVKGKGGYVVSGRLFDTAGFLVVDESVRGVVDTPASSEFETFFGRVFYDRFHAGVNVFRERRENGTRLQKNRSQVQMFETGVRGDAWDLNFYLQSGRFESTFSRILPNRSAEFLTAEQRVPTLGSGASFTARVRKNILIGTDWRYVGWEAQRQNLWGIFAQDLVELHPRLDLFLGGRMDLWENRQRQFAFNPRAGLLFRAADSWTLRASAYRGFRAPTLNELYRPFRVGNIETLANPDLREEHLWGGEAGADFHPTGRVLVRVNGFWNSLRDPVSNVTLSSTPRLILRRRQNLGAARIRGVEAEGVLRLNPHWQLTLAYLYSKTEVQGSRLRLPQVPLHQGSMVLSYTGPLIASVEGRWVGNQFEDDLNQLKLGGYVVLDLMLRKPVSDHLDLFLAVHNILDRVYPVGRTPVETLGTPRLVHGGVQVRFGH